MKLEGRGATHATGLTHAMGLTHLAGLTHAMGLTHLAGLTHAMGLTPPTGTPPTGLTPPTELTHATRATEVTHPTGLTHAIEPRCLSQTRRAVRSRGYAALFAVVLTASGCAPATIPRAPLLASAGPASASPAQEAAVAPRDPPAEGLASCEKARFDVSFARLRAFRRAGWVRAILLTEPRFAELGIPTKVIPFDAAGDTRLCGPRVGAWEAVLVAHTLAEPSLDLAIRMYSARVGGGGPVDLGVAGVRASRIRVGSDVWTSVRRANEPGLLWFVAPAAARASVTDVALGPRFAARDEIALPEGVAARAEMRDPQARIPGAPDELAGLVSLRVELHLTPDGGAKMTGAGRARDEGGARAAALRINARVAGVADSFLVRVALRGVLSGFSARSQGDTIEIELPVSPPQMDAVLSLLGAHVGARFDAEDQASEVNDQASPRQSSPTSARLPGRAARD